MCLVSSYTHFSLTRLLPKIQPSKTPLWPSSGQVVSNPTDCLLVAGGNVPGRHSIYDGFYPLSFSPMFFFNWNSLMPQSRIDLYCELKYCLSGFSDCNSTIELRAVPGVQGTLRTPFFPSYYPPDTNCTWTFTVRHPFILMSINNNCVFICACTLLCLLCLWNFRCPVWGWACLWNLRAMSWAEPATTRPVHRDSGSSRTAGRL